ncbi:MFS transporter [Dietzia sp. SLG310A2-38A2]|uniref:MFS transporter n=1 Tax=Dietzia sp. SLG310A2-38A2 TaxID=1630643 RepID=UPI0015FBE65A|nr:MFS transporter [Dietzia sp. SLG310A2-38A2]MBB1029575.1 MFS transporter [Dietzia sp. SLG310A2-38A2]
MTPRIRNRAWAPLFGVGLFVAAGSAGYFYNLTFVQLGLVDLGARVIGLPDERIARAMALLAGLTLFVALVAGLVMHRRRWSEDFHVKLRLLAVVVVMQTALTAVAPQVRSESGLLMWIAAASVGLGLGVPSLFGLTCDLVPTRQRGPVAAVITSAAFLPAAVFSSDWRIEQFAAQLLWLMTPSAVALVALAFLPWKLTDTLAGQHHLPRYGVGRFVRHPARPGRWPGRAFTLALVLMFGVYFIDSLGFLRIVDSAVYTDSAWHSRDPATLWAIGGAHVLAAALAGILYPALGRRVLLGWIFALFALTQLSYALHALTTPELPPALGLPMLYAVAVSIYTVLNFALWADFSTPATIARNTALGVGVSGWMATFLSTSLSIWWASVELPFAEHLRAVAAISLLLFTVTVVLFLLPERQRTEEERSA